MISFVDHFNGMFRALLIAEADSSTFPEPVIAMPPPPPTAHARHLSSNMRQLKAVLADTVRILSEQPELAEEWRAEALGCGRDMNFIIQQTTSRMRTLGVPEQQGRAP